MDRQIVFPGSIPLDTDILNIQRNTLVALGALMRATVGTGPVIDGLACTPTAPASLTVTVGPGSITALSVVDTLPFGSLAAVPNTPLVKMGVNLSPTSFTLTAPTGSGQAVNYLIEASFSEYDATPVVLPYYNAANPTQPFAGPNNSGAAQNTQRLQGISLQCKPGAPAPLGTQTTPAADVGYVPLWVVTVQYGQTAVTASSIAQVPTAPFLGFKLPSLTPGFSRQQVFTSSTNWVVPPGVVAAKVRLVGGGGGGGGGGPSNSGGGGGAGGYAEGVLALVPGQTVSITVGAGGAPVGPASGANPVQAGAGGATSFGSLMSATGGSGGFAGTSSNPNFGGGYGGMGSGGTINLAGGDGSDGNINSIFAGNGGASAFGGGGRGAIGGGRNGLAPGSGGGGCYQTTGMGGAGAPGLVIVEY